MFDEFYWLSENNMFINPIYVCVGLKQCMILTLYIFGWEDFNGFNPISIKNAVWNKLLNIW